MAANIAYLVDLLSYKVHADYQQWITDPDDPAVKAAVEARRRAGIKPPPAPLVPPVAVRPRSVAAEHEAAYQQLVIDYSAGLPQLAHTKVSADGVGRRWVTDTAEIDRVLDML